MSNVIRISLPFVAGAVFALVLLGSFNMLRSANAVAYQPNMERALGSLHEARESLEISTPDKGGHRVRALELVNQAIVQVRLGINYTE